MVSDIRTTAYFLWEARGQAHGNDLGDWYAAQALLRSKTSILQPQFQRVDPATVLNHFDISRRYDDRWLDSFSWIEIAAHPKSIFDGDRNRGLYFSEGFLWTCHRRLMDIPHPCANEFVYPDHGKVQRFACQLRQGLNLPPPLFLYPAPYQLEIIDGVHRCMAAFELAQSPETAGRFSGDDYTIWVGFDEYKFCAHAITYEIWIRSLLYSEASP